MHLGTSATLCDGSIGIEPSRVAAINIHDRSVCWAAWMMPSKEEEEAWEESRKQGRERPLCQPRAHLFVSPLPYEAWPRLIRMEVRHALNNQFLVTLYSKLAELNINVLSTHSTQNGHSHAVTSLVLDCTQTSIAAASCPPPLRDVGPGAPHRFSSDAIRAGAEESGEYAADTIGICVKLEEVVERVLGENDHYQWQGAFSRMLLKATQERIESEHSGSFRRACRVAILRSYPRQVSCAWLQFYYYAWMLQSEHNPPFIMDYSASAAALRPRNPRALRAVLPYEGEQLPVRGVVSLDRRSSMAKFIFDHGLDEALSAPICVGVEYGLLGRRGMKDVSPSIGLMAASMEGVKDAPIIRLANKVVSCESGQHGDVEEFGSLDITIGGHRTVNPPADSCDDPVRIEFARQSIRTGLSGFAEQKAEKVHVQQLDVAAAIDRPWKMFVSTNADWASGAGREIVGGVSAYARALGLSTAVVNLEKDIDGLPSSVEELVGLQLERLVVEQMRSCHCCLQVMPVEFLCSVGDECNRLRWMHYERGFAKARAMPLALCLEVDRSACFGPDLDAWNRQTQIDVADFKYLFDSREGVQSSVVSLTKAVDYLYKELVSSHRPA